MKYFLALMLLCGSVGLAHAATSAGDLLASCEKSNNATNAKGKYDEKHPDDIYKSGQCSGFIQGWLEGLDESFLTNNADGDARRFVEVSIKWNELPDTWKIAAALQKDLQNAPLDSGKPADTILRKVLLANDLIDLKPYKPPPVGNVKCSPTSASDIKLELR